MLMAVVFGLQLDPERLLWTPAKKLISIPKPILPHYYGPLLTSDMILDAAMERFSANLSVIRHAEPIWDKAFRGDNIKVRLPMYARIT